MNNYLKKSLSDFPGYTPSATVEQISSEIGIPASKIFKLDTGENPEMEALISKKIPVELQFYMYPDPVCTDLIKLLSRYCGVDSDQILCGNGSDEIIDLVIRAVVEKNEEIIISPPTFPMYQFYAKLNGARIIEVNRNDDLSINTGQIIKKISSKTKLIIIDTPGNPTGDITPLSRLEKILKKGIPVIADEAYFEYGKVTALPLLKRYPNLIISRTLSKWAGLAGLRIGYAIARKEFIAGLLSIKPPYNINSLTQVFSVRVMQNPKPLLKKLDVQLKIRDELIEKLSQIPQLRVYPSRGAYILIKPKSSALQLQKALKTAGILVKTVNQANLQNAVKISLPSKTGAEILLKEIRNYFSRFNFDGLIFDMDGVLVDVTESYRQAIAKTVGFFTRKTGDFSTEIIMIKSIPGFNNDWDTSYMLIKLIQNQTGLNDFPENTRPLTIREKNSPLYKQIKEVFQTFYLGGQSDNNPDLKVSQPLRLKEKLLISKPFLQKLSGKYKLGIATSRPREEALFALKQFSIAGYFDEKFVVAREDVPQEKPAPDVLIEVRKRMKIKNPVYIGDTVNDFIAAESALIPFVFVGEKQLGDFQIDSVNGLKGGIINV